jgi:hypothetical protein
MTEQEREEVRQLIREEIVRREVRISKTGLTEEDFRLWRQFESQDQNLNAFVATKTV